MKRDYDGKTIINVTSGDFYNASIQNQLVFSGTSNFQISISANPSQSYNLVLPAIQGSAGQVLANNGSGGLSWTTVSGGSGSVTSVAVTVPSFMSVTGSPITSSGTIAISATSTGTGSVVLATSPTLVTPTLGDATGTSLTLSGAVSSLTAIIGTTVTLDASAATPAYSFIFPSSIGSTGQTLTSGGVGSPLLWQTRIGTLNVTAPAYLGAVVSGTGSTRTLTFTPLVTGTGNMVLDTSPTLVTPTLGVATATSLTAAGFVAARGALGESSTTAGTYIGLSGANAKLELVAATNSALSFIDFTTASPALDYEGRIIYNHTNDTMAFETGGVQRAVISSTGLLVLANLVLGTSFTTTIVTAASASYSFRLPTTAGTTGQVLTSAGGGSPMTWTTPPGTGGTTGIFDSFRNGKHSTSRLTNYYDTVDYQRKHSGFTNDKWFQH